MVKSLNQQQREDYLNDYIDALILECKPAPPPQLDQEMAAILETVRGVKRLRSEKELLSDLLTTQPGLGVPSQQEARMKERQNRSFKEKTWMKWVSVAAVLFLVVGAITLTQRTPSVQEEADEAPMMMRSMEAADSAMGGFYAMAESFASLENYRGVMEIKRQLGDTVWLETVEITFEKPDLFHSVITREDGSTYTMIHDGEGQLISFHGDGTRDVVVQEMTSELLQMQLAEFHMGSLLNEIQSAPEVMEAGMETLNGRETLLYEYRYDPDAPWHRAWVDQSLNLPLKTEANFSNGDQMIREFTSLAVDIPLETSYFAFDLSQSEDVYLAEAPLVNGGQEEPLAAMEAPAEQEMMVMDRAVEETGAGNAAVIGQIDSYYVELRLLDHPAPYQEFKLSEDLRRVFLEEHLQTGTLFSITFEDSGDGVPLLITMIPVDQVHLEALYTGRADSNFAEFSVNGRMMVIALDEKVKETFETLDRQREGVMEGIPVSLVLEASDYSTSGMVVQVRRITE